MCKLVSYTYTHVIDKVVKVWCTSLCLAWGSCFHLFRPDECRCSMSQDSAILLVSRRAIRFNDNKIQIIMKNITFVRYYSLSDPLWVLSVGVRGCHLVVVVWGMMCVGCMCTRSWGVAGSGGFIESFRIHGSHLTNTSRLMVTVQWLIVMQSNLGVWLEVTHYIVEQLYERAGVCVRGKDWKCVEEEVWGQKHRLSRTK